MHTPDEAVNDPTNNEGATEIATKLLSVQDGLYDLRAEVEFYHEAITTLLEHAECQILDTRCQYHGLALTASRISTSMQALSERLGTIREEMMAKDNVQ